MTFDEGEYRRRAAVLYEESPSDLVYRSKLFDLACNSKLAAVPPVPLTPEEIAGGLQGAIYTVGSKAERLGRVLEIVVPQLQAMPDFDPQPGSMESEAMASLVAAAHRARNSLGVELRLRIIALLDRWILRLKPYHSEFGDWESRASSPEDLDETTVRLVREELDTVNSASATVTRMMTDDVAPSSLGEVIAWLQMGMFAEGDRRSRMSTSLARVAECLKTLQIDNGSDRDVRRVLGYLLAYARELGPALDLNLRASLVQDIKRIHSELRRVDGPDDIRPTDPFPLDQRTVELILERLSNH